MANTRDLQSRNRERADPLQPSDPCVEFLCWAPRIHQGLPIPSKSLTENKVNAKQMGGKGGGVGGGGWCNAEQVLKKTF